MTISMIAINRQDSGTYKWFVSSGSEVHHSSFGQVTLKACLTGAGQIVPRENGMVEIIYRHIHMGTHLLEELVSDAERLAKQISQRYSSLVVA